MAWMGRMQPLLLFCVFRYVEFRVSATCPAAGQKQKGFDAFTLPPFFKLFILIIFLSIRIKAARRTKESSREIYSRWLNFWLCTDYRALPSFQYFNFHSRETPSWVKRRLSALGPGVLFFFFFFFFFLGYSVPFPPLFFQTGLLKLLLKLRRKRYKRRSPRGYRKCLFKRFGWSTPFFYYFSFAGQQQQHQLGLCSSNRGATHTLYTLIDLKRIRKKERKKERKKKIPATIAYCWS